FFVQRITVAASTRRRLATSSVVSICGASLSASAVGLTSILGMDRFSLSGCRSFRYRPKHLVHRVHATRQGCGGEKCCAISGSLRQRATVFGGAGATALAWFL